MYYYISFELLQNRTLQVAHYMGVCGRKGFVGVVFRKVCPSCSYLNSNHHAPLTLFPRINSIILELLEDGKSKITQYGCL